jgi:NAD-dependent DNA ligase
MHEKHLRCVNDSCEGKQYENFLKGISLLKMFGVAGSTANNLWEMGLKLPHEVLNKTKVNERTLLASGYFQPGRTLEKFLEERDKIKSIDLELVLLLGGFKGMGKTTSKQIAKQISGLPYSYDGLEKIVVEGFDARGQKFLKLMKMIDELMQDDIKVIKSKHEAQGIKFEMTGSPKSAGFKTKADFLNVIKAKGWVHAKINNSRYLITDNLGADSSKMKYARKYGVKVITYVEALNL